MGNSESTIAGTKNTTKEQATPASACPVDKEARKTWLEAARKNSPPIKESPAQIRGRTNDPSSEPRPSQLAMAQNYGDLGMEHIRQPQVRMKNQVGQVIDPNKIGGELNNRPNLGTDRVTSSIPRADTAPSKTTPDPRSIPSSEGAEEQAGNWIYPSEKMFFDAMKRKSFSPDSNDMPAIVPIHNAVNERAWSMIKHWESSSARLKALNAPCGGPKLRSFSGDAAKLSPKARLLGWVGYQAPFDRHDWVVERCQGGGSVEYVIDFYKGRGDGLAFYLDVRPKLNTWEGCRMRVGRILGLM